MRTDFRPLAALLMTAGLIGLGVTTPASGAEASTPAPARTNVGLEVLVPAQEPGEVYASPFS
jgi:hypothetical protein